MECLDSSRAILGEVDEERGREVGDTDGRSRVLRWDPTCARRMSNGVRSPPPGSDIREVNCEVKTSA